MTVQVDSQPVTDHIMWYIDMCYINNSISCLEKKTTVKNTWSDMLCPHQCLSKFNWVFVPPSNVCQNSTWYLSHIQCVSIFNWVCPLSNVRQIYNVCLSLISWVYMAWAFIVWNLLCKKFTFHSASPARYLVLVKVCLSFLIKLFFP